ncbi:MAG: TolC family protein [Opitutales bacterium]|nr:TolC family protein [Opitutales bacterium]
MILLRRLFIALFASAIPASALATLPEAFRADGLLYPEEVFPALQSLLRDAARHSPEIGILQQRITEREGNLLVADSHRRFRVDANARVLGAYEMREDIPDRFRGAFNANTLVSRPLYHWGRLENQSAIGELALEAAHLNFERGSREHLHAVRVHYLQWVHQHERLAKARRSTSLLEQLTAAEERQLEAGRSTENAVIDLRARLAESIEFVAFIERETLHQRQTLERLTGSRDLAEPSTGAGLDFTPMTLANIERLQRRFALLPPENTPTVRLEETLREIEDRRYQIAERNRYPRLDFVAGVLTDQLDAFDSSDFALRIQYFAGVQVSWNIFDGGRTRGEKMAALARRRIHDLQAEGQRFRLDAETERIFADIEFAVKQFSARATRADLARRRLDLIQRQVADNLATETQRIEAELELAERNLRVGESRVQYLLALAQLASLHFPDPAAR